MYGGDKSCITNRFLQGATTPNGLWEPVLGKGDGRRHCGWFLHARRPSWCRCSPPITCTIGMNLLPRKGQALSQKEFSRKVPETHISLPFSESHCNTFFFFTQGKGETNTNCESHKMETLLKCFLGSSPPWLCTSWLLSKSWLLWTALPLKANDLLEKASALVKDRVWEEDA